VPATSVVIALIRDEEFNEKLPVNASFIVLSTVVILPVVDSRSTATVVAGDEAA